MKNILTISILALMFLASCEIEEEKNTMPEKPTLNAPANATSNIATEGTTLNWNCTDVDGDQLKYKVFFGKNNPPTTLETETSTTSYSTGKLEAETSYYWQIEANDGNKGTSSSDIYSFTSGPESNPDAVPENPYPTDSLSNVSIPVTFSWECNNSAVTGYEVYMSDDPNNLMNGMVSAPTQPTFTISNLQPNTTYYWFVVGRTNNQQVNFRGNSWIFTTAE
ncbi:MAG: fibronectin type III domain-containing protein [Salinivirgaceae bacterium]|nr:fibronectin type III domain-containing protein [Salinivirgaceae bacterium]